MQKAAKSQDWPERLEEVSQAAQSAVRPSLTGRKCQKEKAEVKQEQDLVRTRADWARQRVVSKGKPGP